MAAVKVCVINSFSKMEILRGLITEKFTVAVQEILAVVETTVAGYDNEVMLLRRELDHHKRQLSAILLPQVSLDGIQRNSSSQTPTKVSHERDKGVCSQADISDSYSVPCPPVAEELHRDGDDCSGSSAPCHPTAEEPHRDKKDCSGSSVPCQPSAEEPHGDESYCSPDISDSSGPGPAEECPPRDEDDSVNEARSRQRYRVKCEATDSDTEVDREMEWKPDKEKTRWSSNVKRKALIKHNVRKPAISELEEQPSGSGHGATHTDEPEETHFSDSEAESGAGEDEDEEHSAAPKSNTKISTEDLKCKVCESPFKSKSALTKHALRSHLDDENVLCGVCGQHLDTPAELKPHLEAHVKRHQCEHCGRHFLSSNSFQSHRVACHTGQREYPESVSLQEFFQCECCLLSFRFKSELEAHSRQHMGEKPFCCAICGEQFITFSLFCTHLQKHTGEKKTYTCPQCGKTFSTMPHLRRHKKIHTDREKSHLCELCSAAFPTKGQLKSHQMRKHGEPPLVTCPVCGKQLRGGLREHMKVHTGEKPYLCQECGMGFKTHNAHKNHMDVHLGVKRFSCSACEYKCSRKEHLKVHMSTHTGEKPYKCSQCSAAFTQSHCLKSHMKSHHKEDPSAPQATS